jgi:hypothetical protein
MQLKNKLGLILSLLISTIVLGQTPGFNYQALILNNQEIQVPGTDVKSNKVPLSLEDVVLRFTITNDAGLEYEEEHIVTTDENGMISLIVGEGTPINFSFENINWDGKLKYLNVELDIISNNEGFVFLDAQKILYIPHPTNGIGVVKIVNSLNDLNPPYALGELIWLTNYGKNNNTTLMIWSGESWSPVNEDYDATNEFNLLVVASDTARDTQFEIPSIGNQVWNQACDCAQVYDGFNWISATSKSLNGLYNDGDTIKLGGKLIEPTEITTSATNTFALKDLQESTYEEDQLVLVDKNTGVLRKRSFSSISQKKQTIIIAVEGQLEFKTPLTITSTDKIDVYRNGIRIDFTAIDNSTIKLEPEAICYKNDKIRIVQLN